MIKPIKGIKKNCRYCKREEPLVSFKEKTHFIPELLNGSKSISYFECDSCNKIFSKYENDFGRYTQFDRALFGLKKKKSRSSKI